MSISIQKLKQIAMAASATLDNTNTTSVPSELPTFAELLSVNQSEIDIIESEIHNIVTSATAPSSSLLEAWGKLLEIHRHMVAEATKVASEFQDQNNTTEQRNDVNAEQFATADDETALHDFENVSTNSMSVTNDNDDFNLGGNIIAEPTKSISKTPKPSNNKQLNSAHKNEKPMPPALIIEVYNSLNITFERAIRSLSTYSPRQTHANGNNSNSAPLSPSTLLSLLLKNSKNKEKTTTIEQKTEDESEKAKFHSIGNYSLWREYLSTRLQQALQFGLSLKRVLYPLFDRASASVPFAIRLRLDFCDLCLHLLDFTKLRVALQEAFASLPSATHHAALWQYIRNRVFGVTFVSIEKLCSESIVFKSLESSSNTTGAAASTGSSLWNSSQIPRNVLLLFWREYVEVYPTDRTNSEYLSFLSSSIRSADEEVKKLTAAGEDNELLSAAQHSVLYYATAFMNFVTDVLFVRQMSQQTKEDVALPASTTSSANSSSNSSGTTTVEVWENVAYVLQCISSHTSHTSYMSQGFDDNKVQLAPKELRRWIEQIVVGIERSDFEAKAMSEPPTSANNDATSVRDKFFGNKKKSQKMHHQPIPLATKIEIFYSCALALNHFGLFDEAFELLWGYVIKQKGAFGNVNVFQSVFSLVCRMLQTTAEKALGGQPPETVDDDGEDNPILTENISQQPKNTQSSSLSQTTINRQHSNIASLALKRLEDVTEQYNRIRLEILLRQDRRNVEAWQERIATFRDSLEAGTVTREEVKRVYLQAIQALSSTAASQYSKQSDGASAAADLLSSVDALEKGLPEGHESQLNRHEGPSLTEDAMSAVIAVYEDYANFLYLYDKDYEGLKSFLTRSILTSNFGDDKLESSSHSLEQGNNEGGEGGDVENQFDSISSSAPRGIKVNVQLLGMLIERTLEHQGPQGAAELIQAWIRECPLAADNNGSVDGGDGKSALYNAQNRKRERDYYRNLSENHHDRLKQRRVGLFGSIGGGGPKTSSATSVTTRLWQSESMWDLLLYFANLIDKQLNKQSLKSTTTNGDNTTISVAAVVWSRCVDVQMATPWLAMRLVIRILTEAGAQNIPNYILGVADGDKNLSISVSKGATSVIPHSLLGTSWSSLQSLRDRFSATENNDSVRLFEDSDDQSPLSTSAANSTRHVSAAMLSKQLAAVQESLKALGLAISSTRDTTALATMSFWSANLRCEESKLLSQLADINSGTKAVPGNRADLLVRESVRATLTTGLASVASEIDSFLSGTNQDPAALSALSSATTKLLLRYIWWEGVQVPARQTSANLNSSQNSSLLTSILARHNVESFPALGTSFMPLLICPHTLRSGLFKAEYTGTEEASPSSNLPNFCDILSAHDRYRVADVLLKVLTATRGPDFTIAVSQTALRTTTSSTDVAFLAVRMVSCLLMTVNAHNTKEVTTQARNIFDHCCATQVAALAGGGKPANPQESTEKLQPSGDELAIYKTFWATWLELEHLHGTPATIANYNNWYSRVARVLGDKNTKK